MPNDIPQRYAKIVLSELADIHALLLCISDAQIADAATQATTEVDEDARLRIWKSYDAKREAHRKKIYATLLKDLGLPEQDATA